MEKQPLDFHSGMASKLNNIWNEKCPPSIQVSSVPETADAMAGMTSPDHMSYSTVHNCDDVLTINKDEVTSTKQSQ